MKYPVWDVGLGYGLLMAVISIVHVFVSHFAIGGGLYLVVAERAARRRNDQERLDFLRVLSRFFVLTTVVFGALTGVAIWFIIGLLNPTATEALIHHFVWGWATEWTFFAVEILAALLYYYGWERLSARHHMQLGWIYFGAAWLSLFVINGILTFMLTPGAWMTSGSFWDGFFNPGFWPALVLRTGICIGLAGLFALLVASWRAASAGRARLVRGNALWALVGLAIAVPSFLWFRGTIPEEVLATVGERLAIPAQAEEVLLWSTVGVGAIALLGLLLPALGRPWVALPLMLVGLVCFGSFEWFRESVRKPYVIHGYMYGNGFKIDDAERYREEGLLPHVAWRTGDDGADLFRVTCRSCHTIDGYNPLKAIYDGTDRDFIAGTIRGLHVMRGKMPPFPGTAEESLKLADHIHSRIDQRPFTELHALQGVELGRKVYEVRCALCHVRGGHGDKTDTLADLEQEDFVDLLGMEDLAEEMPAFTGSDAEREALIQYLLTWKAEDDG